MGCYRGGVGATDRSLGSREWEQEWLLASRRPSFEEERARLVGAPGFREWAGVVERSLPDSFLELVPRRRWWRFWG